MAKRYRVTLTGEERQHLETLTKKDKGTARKFIHARALLLCDYASKEKPWKVAKIAKALGVTSRTVERTMRLLAEKVVELEIAPEVSVMTIQRTLKKTNLSLT